MQRAEAYLNVLRLYRKTRSYAKKDPEVAVVLARKTTEAICKFIYSTRVSTEPNSRMLEELLSGFSKDRTITRKILTPMRTIQSYGNFCGHDQEDEYGEIDPLFVVPCISALETVVSWFQQENAMLEWVLTTSVHHVRFSDRALSILDNANVTSLAELCLKTEAELLKYRGLGTKVLNEIKAVLAEHGLGLGMRFDAELIKGVSNKAFHHTVNPRRVHVQ